MEKVTPMSVINELAMIDKIETCLDSVIVKSELVKVSFKKVLKKTPNKLKPTHITMGKNQGLLKSKDNFCSVTRPYSAIKKPLSKSEDIKMLF